MTALPAVEPYLNPGCPDGPQGFHIYDPLYAAGYPAERIPCLYCDKDAHEVEILAELSTYQPPPGSIVVQEGLSGIAWQRFYREPYNWKTITGRGAVWHSVLERSRPNSRVWLVFVPPVPRSPR